MLDLKYAMLSLGLSGIGRRCYGFFGVGCDSMPIQVKPRQPPLNRHLFHGLVRPYQSFSEIVSEFTQQNSNSRRRRYWLLWSVWVQEEGSTLGTDTSLSLNNLEFDAS